jgi:hypothetical protein
VGMTLVETVGEAVEVVGEDPAALSEAVVDEERARTAWTRWQSVRHRRWTR